MVDEVGRKERVVIILTLKAKAAVTVPLTEEEEVVMVTDKGRVIKR